RRFEVLGYEGPPEILTAADQFAKVHELLCGESASQWPAYGGMLELRGFADQVRQFVTRSQEALLTPDDIVKRAAEGGLTGWEELAGFYRRYLDILLLEGRVDFAGLLVQASTAAEQGEPVLDHVLVDDYQDTTLAAESLLVALRSVSLVVAGNAA